MDQSWFEMQDVRRRRLDGSSWIPLRETRTDSSGGRNGTAGFTEEVILRASIAVPAAQRALAEQLDWHDLSVREHRVYVENGRYTPADIHRETSGRGAGLEALRLVVEQPGNREEPVVWHLHPDFVVALALKREGDTWLSQVEGYEPAARLLWKPDGRPQRLEVRAELLKDYLAARDMALYVSSYRQRQEVRASVGDITWAGDQRDVQGFDRWEGTIREIHEGGQPFGAKTAVFHMSRTDVDAEEDVPVMGAPGDGNVESEHWTIEARGRKLYRVTGALWRREWVEPGRYSSRVRDDDVPSTTSFIVDASGERLSADDLKDDDSSGGGRWLWFRPEVMEVLSNRRGGLIEWYTRDTGNVRCSPDYDVHFGMNDLGWVTVYAEDVARLPEWQRRIWGGFNVAPDGKVSRELLASQVHAVPAQSFAAEDALPHLLNDLDGLMQALHGFKLFRGNGERAAILTRAHRFRACDRAGLLALAKDLARGVVEDIDHTALQRVVRPPPKEKWGSLKSLENLLAVTAGPVRARAIMGPVAGINELRHADAHLPGPEVAAALVLAGVDESLPPVLQGRQLLESLVAALSSIARELHRLLEEREGAVSPSK